MGRVERVEGRGGFRVGAARRGDLAHVVPVVHQQVEVPLLEVRLQELALEQALEGLDELGGAEDRRAVVEALRRVDGGVNAGVDMGCGCGVDGV